MATFTVPQLAAAFHHVRTELAEVGLLRDGRYLDHIECWQHHDPFAVFGAELGRVYDEGVGGYARWVGFEAGHIYLSAWAPVSPRTPGYTLRDVVRHEFAHAWAWLDAPFLRRPWFRHAFGARYDAKPWVRPPVFDRTAFATPYACGQAKEDFAETFMLFLRERRRLGRFAHRRAFHAKLLAVQSAVAEAASTRVATVRVRTARS